MAMANRKKVEHGLSLTQCGYARHRLSGRKIDVDYIDEYCVSGITHDTQCRAEWQLGRGIIEIIEFGSFNKRNKNYRPGGKVVKVL